MLLIYLSMIDTDEEREFFLEIYSKYRYSLFGMAYKYLKNASDSEDAVQDVFVIVINNHLRQLMARSEKDRRRFLFICVKNRALKILKNKSKLVSLEGLMEAGWDTADESDADIEDLLIDIGTVNRAYEALKGFDSIYSDVLWLNIKGFTAAEISNVFGESFEMIRKRLYRAKLMLRKAVLEEGGEQ